MAQHSSKSARFQAVTANRLNNGEGFAAVAASMLGWTDADTNLGKVVEANLDGALVGPAFAARAAASNVAENCAPISDCRHAFTVCPSPGRWPTR